MFLPSEYAGASLLAKMSRLPPAMRGNAARLAKEGGIGLFYSEGEGIMEWSEYIERKYEMMFGEPWADLEQRVRKRHPDIAMLIDCPTLPLERK